MKQTLFSYRLLPLLGLVALAVILAACGAQVQAQPMAFDSNAALAAQTPSLVGPVWQWQETQFNNDTELSVDDPTLYTVQFGEDGAVNIKADCNRASGSYTVEGGSLRIELGPTTLALCSKESLSQEFLDQLSFAASYVFDGDRLVINMQMDAGNMILAQAPQETPTPEPEETPTEEPEPTETPTQAPEASPTPEPTETPTQAPEASPTPEPTQTPTQAPKPTPKPDDDMARFVGEYKVIVPPAEEGGAILLVTLNLNEDGSLRLEVADLGAGETVEYEGAWTVEDGDVVAEVIISKKETQTFRLSVDENGNLSVEGADFVLTHIDETIPLHKQLPIPVDLSQRAYATVDIQAGNPLDPFIISVNGGGVLDGSGLGGDCVGFINIEPVVRVKWRGEVDFARIFFYSDHDPTLIVQGPDGAFHCNDDANVLLLDPSITIDEPQEGLYNIWVGSYKPDQLIPGVLVITTREDVSVETFTLEGLVKRGPMPDVGRAPGGKAPDELIEAIRNLKKDVESLKAGRSFTQEVTVDGDVPAFEFDIEGQRCNGFIKSQPDLAFDWSGQAEQLNIYFEGDDDATLLVVAANGQITCNDDADDKNLNPMITLETPQEGRYAVFVGRVKPDVEVSGVLTVTDEADAQPQALAPKSFSLGSDNQ